MMLGNVCQIGLIISVQESDVLIRQLLTSPLEVRNKPLQSFMTSQAAELADILLSKLLFQENTTSNTIVNNGLICV